MRFALLLLLLIPITTLLVISLLTTLNMTVTSEGLVDLVQLPKQQEQQRQVFVVMVEPRCVPAVPFVLENALNKTTFNVIMFYSHHNAPCMDEWIVNSPTLANATQSGRLKWSLEYDDLMDPFAKDVYSPHNWNNVLFRNISFWSSLQRKYGDTALTIQTDTLICSSNQDIPNWNANYLGGISSPISVLRKKEWKQQRNTYHLNGGLSIRNLDWVIRCLQETPLKDQINIVEDAVFNNCSQQQPVISVLDAMTFASDFGYTKCINDDMGNRTCPWGVHKPWMYTHGNYLELLKYCPDIIKLQRLVQYAKHKIKETN